MTSDNLGIIDTKSILKVKLNVYVSATVVMQSHQMPSCGSGILTPIQCSVLELL